MNISYDQIAKLSPEERALLEKLMEAEGIDTSALPIPRRQHGTNVPLTPTQLRFWLLERIHPGTSAYNIPIILKIKGKLSLNALEKSFGYLIQRHSLFRTKFIEIDEEHYQQIYDFEDYKLNIIELDRNNFVGNEPEILKILNNELQRPFDFNNDFLLRIKLIKGNEDEYILSIVTHHLVADGWSLRTFLKELNDLYIAFDMKKNIQLKELTIDFPDYACWLNNHLDNKNTQQQLEYWKNKLSGASLILDLPTDFTRPPIEKYRGSAFHFEFREEQLKKINYLTGKLNVTRFVLLMSFFQALLHKYSNQNDVIVATAISNRGRTETENLIGNFSNNLLIYTDFTEDLTLDKFTFNVRQTFLEALQHKDLPFEKLVEEMKVDRNLSRNALFQVMFVLHEGRHDKLINFSETEVLELDPEITSSKFDLFLEIYDNKNSLKGVIEYNTDLFRANTIELMVNHFVRLIEYWSENSERSLSEIDIRSPEEIQLLNKISNNKTSYPEDSRLHDLFEIQAKKTPDRIAVECDGVQLTYSELNGRANQVAHSLRYFGIEERAFVGILFERSIEMLIAILGSLKAGCAYIPLDPAFPTSRLNYMIEDAKIKALLTSSNLKFVFNSKEDLKYIFLDGDSESIKEESKENINSNASSEDLAYVIYTSGSTGDPKGVQIRHKSVVNFLLSMQKEPGITEEDVLVSVTTISFDISVLELFLPIITGAKLVIANKAATLDGKVLIRLLEESNATILQATPSTWRLMIDSGWKSLPNLKMLCGGEAFSSELANEMLDRGESLWNMYGPTETTIWSAVKKIGPGSEMVLIGLPIANTQFYILDRNLKSVAVGIPGELFIGGDGLAKGYLNKAALTSEKFIQNPFANSGSKLYRTGDLVRIKNSGDIEFLGRLDFQVKIRGYRIELGEIENILSTHPKIKDVVVNVWQDSSGDKKLVSYYTSNYAEVIGINDLRSHLANKLPEYMIPSFFIKLDKFPLTPNAKIDRKKLPLPDISDFVFEKKFIPPSTDMEIQLAEIWKEVMNLKKIGVNDNFFDLGGHSLLLTRIVMKVMKRFNVELSLINLFKAPTIASFVNEVEKARNEGSQLQTSAIVPVSRDLYLVNKTN